MEVELDKVYSDDNKSESKLNNKNKQNKEEKRALKKAAYVSQKDSDASTLNQVMTLIKTKVKRKNQRHLRIAAKQFSEPSLKRVLTFESEGKKDIEDIIKQEIVVTAQHNILFIKRLRDVQSVDKPSEYDLLLPHSVLIHNLKTLQDHFLSWGFFFDVLSCPLDTDDLIKYLVLNELSGTLIGYESINNILIFSAVIVGPLILLLSLVYCLVNNMGEDAHLLNEQYTEARVAVKALILVRLLLLILVTSLTTALLDVFAEKVGGNLINFTTLSFVIVALVVFIVAHETSRTILGFKRSNNVLWFLPLSIFFFTNLTITILSLLPQYFILADREVGNQEYKCPNDFFKIVGTLLCGFYRMFKSLFQTFIGVFSIIGLPLSELECFKKMCNRKEGSYGLETRELMIEECVVIVPDNVQLRKMDRQVNETSNASNITESDVRRVNEGWGDVNDIYKTTRDLESGKDSVNNQTSSTDILKPSIGGSNL